MAEKSVREMTELERRHNSLSAKVFHATLMSSVVLGLVAVLIGLGLYLYALIGQYAAEAFSLARSAAVVTKQIVDAESMADEVMRIYDAMTPEERAMKGTDEYYARFAHVTGTDDYERLRRLLEELNNSGDVEDLYFAVYDRKTSAVIYVCDPETQKGFVCPTGDWEPLEERELNKFLDWNGTGKLYDIGNTEKYGLLCTAGVPLEAVSGESGAFLLADITLNNFAAGVEVFAVPYVLALALVVLVLGFLLTRHMRRTLVRPINAIAEAAQDYISDKREGLQIADHFAMLNIRTGDEVENLSLVMADMERGLAEYEDNLTSITAEKERLNTELDLANRIQAHTLPDVFPPFPDRKEFDIYATMNPAREVGGDFYDFFFVDKDRLALVMADVSGKGIPGALCMMMAKILVQNGAMTGLSPHEVLEKVNTQFCANNREEMFVTVWLGILDLSNGRLTACNAGHEYPILKRPDGVFEILKDRHGLVLGGMENVRYQDYEVDLEPGSILFLYTDGLPEATNAGDELYGMERVLRALNTEPDGAPETILENMQKEVDRFTGAALQSDDLTMMCLRFNGKQAGEVPGMKKIEVEAKIDNLEKVTDFVNAELEALDCPVKTQMQIDVAVDELFTNVSTYAYAPGTGNVEVCFAPEDGGKTAVITIVDRGMPFNPIENEDPDVTLDANKRPIGGLGIFLVKKTMDDMRYERRDGQNIIQIRKRL